jgi:subtilisin family serine protease
MSLPTDTDFADQWYLKNAVTGQYDLDVVKAWDDYTGKGVKVVVMDDGFDQANPDLAPNYDTSLDHDYGNNDDDASPYNTSDNHGTSVMGIVGAAENGTGVVGVAYGASLIGFRMEYGSSAPAWRDAFIAALGDAATNGGSVVNMSFGDSVSYDVYGADNAEQMRAALGSAVADGRDGLGLVLVKAAGNERQDPDGINEGLPIDVNHSTMDSDSRQIIVAATDADGFVTQYSNPGAAILVSAFGSPYDGTITTTDRVGSAGYNTDPDDPGIFSNFAGTSAATPMVSGIVALMLEANPDLGWRDVQTILAYTARHVGSAVDGSTVAQAELNPWDWNAAGNWNGGGLHFSEDYGYGLVDALAAVRLAESWRAQSTSDNEDSAALDLVDTATAIPDNDATGTSFSGAMTKSIDVERVTVDVTLTAGDAQDIAIYITSPDGTEERLLAYQNKRAYGSSYSGTLHLNSQGFRGEDSDGTWTVRVADNQAGSAISVSNIVLTAYGQTASDDNTYVYTNEFSDFAGTGGHSANLKDGNGGSDTIDAAAVTAAMTVDLSAGTGSIDGVAMKIRGIENVFGGDGRDSLTGNKAANELDGGRGADILIGGKGNDDFIYNTISDSLTGKKCDTIGDFSTGDIIDLSGIDTGEADGDQAFKYLGAKAFNGKAPEVDFDLVDKKGTAHDQTLVYADLDMDKKADFEIELTGLHPLKAGDFML